MSDAKLFFVTLNLNILSVHSLASFISGTLWKVSTSITKYCQVLSRIAKYYQVLPSIAKYCQVLPSMAKYHQVSPSMDKYGQVSPSIAKYCQVLPSIAQDHQVLPSITKYCQSLVMHFDSYSWFSNIVQFGYHITSVKYHLISSRNVSRTNSGTKTFTFWQHHSLGGITMPMA